MLRGSWLWNQWACTSGVQGGGVIDRWPWEGRVMLDTLERLLPIPTGAKMDRWRKMVIQRIKRKQGWSKRGGKRQKCTGDIFRASCTQTEWVTWCSSWRCVCNRKCWGQVSSVSSLFNPCQVLQSQQRAQLFSHTSLEQLFQSGCISTWLGTNSPKCANHSCYDNITAPTLQASE